MTKKELIRMLSTEFLRPHGYLVARIWAGLPALMTEKGFEKLQNYRRKYKKEHARVKELETRLMDSRRLRTANENLSKEVVELREANQILQQQYVALKYYPGSK